MSLIADALQPLLVRELSSVAGRLDLNPLPDIITDPKSAFMLRFNDSDRSIELDLQDAKQIGTLLAADCCRFSMASFQTISNLDGHIAVRDYVAWCMIRIYYAAFYSGHALLRLFGETCSYLDHPHVSRLEQLGAAFGLRRSFGIDRGLYRTVLSSTETALCLTKASGAGVAAHDVFWGIFGRQIQRLSDAVLGGPMLRTDAQLVFAQMQGLVTVMRRRGGFGWLSFIRNEIQYRHRLNVWFPSNIKARERDMLRGLATHWNKDPMLINLQTPNPTLLGDFVSACTFIIALCNTMLLRIDERSLAGQDSFVKKGPWAYLNDIRPRI